MHFNWAPVKKYSFFLTLNFKIIIKSLLLEHTAGIFSLQVVFHLIASGTGLLQEWDGGEG